VRLRDAIIGVLGLLLAMVVSPFILLTCYLACKIDGVEGSLRES